jgi:hypothetical protein
MRPGTSAQTGAQTFTPADTVPARDESVFSLGPASGPLDSMRRRSCALMPSLPAMSPVLALGPASGFDAPGRPPLSLGHVRGRLMCYRRQQTLSSILLCVLGLACDSARLSATTLSTSPQLVPQSAFSSSRTICAGFAAASRNTLSRKWTHLFRM